MSGKPGFTKTRESGRIEKQPFSEGFLIEAGESSLARCVLYRKAVRVGIFFVLFFVQGVERALGTNIAQCECDP